MAKINIQLDTKAKKVVQKTADFEADTDVAIMAPSGDIQITENGRYDVRSYANAEVNVTVPEEGYYYYLVSSSGDQGMHSQLLKSDSYYKSEGNTQQLTEIELPEAPSAGSYYYEINEGQSVVKQELTNYSYYYFIGNNVELQSIDYPDIKTQGYYYVNSEGNISSVTNESTGDIIYQPGVYSLEQSTGSTLQNGIYNVNDGNVIKLTEDGLYSIEGSGSDITEIDLPVNVGDSKDISISFSSGDTKKYRITRLED